jgi:hypothetical protein
MATAFTTVIQTRVNSENYLSGTLTGSAASGYLSNEAWTTINATTAFSVPVVTIANMQSYFFMVDQGTVASPVAVIFTSSTAKTVQLNMLAGVPWYWDLNGVPVTAHTAADIYGIFSGDNNAGTVTAFGNIASATYNIPTALGVATVNWTGRITTN